MGPMKKKIKREGLKSPGKLILRRRKSECGKSESENGNVDGSYKKVQDEIDSKKQEIKEMEKKETKSDMIHDQTNFINRKVLSRLKERGIEFTAFIQNKGD